MNLASALFKRILEEEDFDTWSSLRRHYLPSEYHVVYDIVDKQIDSYHKLPTIEEDEYDYYHKNYKDPENNYDINLEPSEKNCEINLKSSKQNYHHFFEP